MIVANKMLVANKVGGIKDSSKSIKKSVKLKTGKLFKS